MLLIYPSYFGYLYSRLLFVLKESMIATTDCEVAIEVAIPVDFIIKC